MKQLSHFYKLAVKIYLSKTFMSRFRYKLYIISISFHSDLKPLLLSKSHE